MSIIMRVFSIYIFFIFFFSLHLLAINKYPSPEVTFVREIKKQPNPTVQSYLRNKSSWKAFKKEYGDWYVEFDELTGQPHRTFGRPINVNFSISSEANANIFVNEILPKYFLIDPSDFKQTHFSTSKYHYIDYEQYYKGLKVLSSRITLRLSKDNQVLMFGLDVFNDINVDTEPFFSNENINNYALNGIAYSSVDVVKDAELKILPVPDSNKYSYKLVYEMIIQAEEENSFPGMYYTLVDAHTGQVWYRHNLIANTTNVEATVQAHLYPTNLLNPDSLLALPNLKMIVNGARTYFLDSVGEIILDDTSMVSATFPLEGKWAKIINAGIDATPYIDTVLQPGDNMLLLDTFDIHHLSAYYHTNTIHDHTKNWLPDFTAMDNPLTVNVELTTGTCNAFYAPFANTLNFFKKGGMHFSGATCNTFAGIADIVYHEYGHGINNNFYLDQGDINGMSNGALNEGYADIWALTITQNPILGSGVTNNINTVIRRYDINPKVYPDDLVGEVHDDGEIIAGAWWDVGVNLDSVGLMTEIFAEAFYGLADGFNGNEGKVYRDALIDAILADDNNNNLNDGTPNALAILTAFAAHGITLLIGDISHDEILYADEESDIFLTANIGEVSFFLNDPKIYYKTNLDSVTKIILMDDIPDSIGQFQGLIPPQPKGTIIEYYLSFPDILDNESSVLPINVKEPEPTLPYYILCGFNNKAKEDFDNNFGNWVINDGNDDATRGLWEIGEPIASFVNTSDTSLEGMIQPGIDHTTEGINTNICAYTENANNIYVSPTARDVDNGKTTLFSPIFDISNYINPAFSYYRWYTNDQGNNPGTEYWSVYVTGDGSDWEWILIENTNVSDRNWRRFVFSVEEYLGKGNQVQLKFVAADENGGETLVEAAVDDLYLYDIDSVIQNEVTPTVSFFPNPSGNNFFLLLNEANGYNYTVEIFDLVGRLIYSVTQTISGSTVVTISTSGWQTGIYEAKVSSELVTIKERLLLVD